MTWLLKYGMRIVRIVAGLAILLIGMGLGFVPGIPGFPFVLIGLTILAVDFAWARLLKKKLREHAARISEKFRGRESDVKQ